MWRIISYIKVRFSLFFTPSRRVFSTGKTEMMSSRRVNNIMNLIHGRSLVGLSKTEIDCHYLVENGIWYNFSGSGLRLYYVFMKYIGSDYYVL